MSANKTANPFMPVRLLSIVMLALCVALFASCSGGDINGPQYSFSTDGCINGDPDFTANKTYINDIPVEGRDRVTVEAINGEVVVTGREDVNRVMVTARLFVSSDSLQDAQSQLDTLDVRVTVGANEILIQTVQPETINGCTHRVEYDINVPDSLEVVTTQTNGTVAVLDIQNRVEVSNENGNISLFGIVGGILADVENGLIESTAVLPLNETIDLSTQNGGIVLSIPTSTAAEFAATVNGIGTVSVSNLTMTDSAGTGKWQTGTLGSGQGSLVLSTVNGNIEVIGFN